MEKNLKKEEKIYTCITVSLYCVTETNTTL